MFSQKFLHRLPLLTAVVGSLCLAVYLGVNEYGAVKQDIDEAEPVGAQISTIACTNGIDDDRDGVIDSADRGCRRSNGGTEIDNMGVGVNLNYITYYSTELLFIDSMKYVSGIQSDGALWTAKNAWHCPAGTTTAPSVALTPTGWPLGGGPIYCTFAHVHVPYRSWPEGRFWVKYEGTGQVRIASQTFSTPNTWVQTTRLAGDIGISIHILNSNPADPVRNIRLIPHGTRSNGLANHEAYQLFLDNQTNPAYWEYQFTEKFLELSAPFAWFRFMDTLAINQHAAKTLADILPSNYATYSSLRDGLRPQKMMPLRPLIHLCNVMRQRYSDFQGCWFNVPPEMDNEGYQYLAREIRDTLDPRLEAYIEYGNEIWNNAPGFWHHWNFVEQYRIAMGCTVEWCHEKAWAKLAGNMFNQFTAVWNEQSDPSRKPKLMRVAAAQAAFPTRSIALITRLKNETVDRKFEIISGAPYFGGSSARTASADTITTAILTFLNSWKGKIQDYSTIREQLSNEFGFYVRQIEYEGGSHVTDRDNMVAAHQSPAMYTIYRKYLQRLADSGYDGMTLYTFVQGWSPRFAWGHLQTMTDDLNVAYKYNAIKDFVAEQKAFVSNGTQVADWLPPILQTSNIEPGFTNATISFSANEPFKYTYRYWPADQGTGSLLQGSNTLSVTHTLSLSGLEEGRGYKFDVTGEDAAGNKHALIPVTTFITQSVGPVLYLPFESVDAGTTPDASTNQLVARVIGSVPLSTEVPPQLASRSTRSMRIDNRGKPNTADPLRSYVRIDNHITLNPPGSITFSMWVKSLNTSSAFITTKRGVDSNAGNQFELGSNPNRLSFKVYEKGNTTTPVIAAQTTGSFTFTSWHHFVAIADASERLLKVYVDGVLVGTKAYSGLLNQGTLPLGIGVTASPNSASDNEWYFNGLVDEYRVYNRPLSGEDVAALFRGEEPLGGAAPPPASSSSSLSSGGSSSSRSSSVSSAVSSSSAALASACINTIDPNAWHLQRGAPATIILKQGTTDVFTANATADANGKIVVSHASLGTLVSASNYSLSVHARGYQKTTLTNLTNVQVLAASCTSASMTFGDFNGDGSLTVADLLMMLQFLRNGDNAQMQAVFGSVPAKLMDLVKLIRLFNS